MTKLLLVNPYLKIPKAVVASLIEKLAMMNSLRSRLKKWSLVFLPVESRFSLIYKKQYWGKGQTESASGQGSSLAATEKIRIQLPEILKNLSARKMLDIGCGDFNWMRAVDLDIDYLGVDVVEHLIESNKENHETERIKFAVMNAIVDPVPSDIDVILCREVLFHLSLDHACEMISNIKNSNTEYLIATQIDLSGPNKDTYTGGYRPLDLMQHPFNFPEPIHVIADDGVSNARKLAVWDIESSKRLDDKVI